MKAIIEEMLLEITEDKKQNRIEPSYVLRYELLAAVTKRVYRALAQLRQEGKIESGETMNDIYITIIK